MSHLMIFKVKPCFVVARLLLCIFVCSTTANLQAQDWHVNHAPLHGPVPQYVSPSYPLHEPAKAPNQATQPATVKITPPQAVQTIQPLPLPSTIPAEIEKPEKKTEKLKPHYGIDYSIYRDKNPYPIDPRKPCNICVRPDGVCPKCNCNLPGVNGRPYMDKEPGGCKCAKKNPARHPDFSLYWPRPFSARLDEAHPEDAAARYSGCPKKRFVDVFDSLSTFKLSGYKRTDNGYCGDGSDPFGCVGESKHIRR